MNSDDKMVSFFSFLAGFFLLRRSSTCGELSYLMNDFTNRFNIYIDDDNDDLYLFNRLVCFKDKDINLRYDYDDIININGNTYRVNDYLYSLTTDEVREYFGIPYKGNRIKRKTKVS